MSGADVDSRHRLPVSRDQPIERIWVVTPNDSADLARVTRAIMLEADGVVNMIAADDTVAVALPLRGMLLYPIAVKRILLTGTSGGTVWAMD